jgi:hypothetical protein
MRLGLCIVHYGTFSKVTISDNFAAIIEHFILTSVEKIVAQKFGEK